MHVHCRWQGPRGGREGGTPPSPVVLPLSRGSDDEMTWRTSFGSERERMPSWGGKLTKIQYWEESQIRVERSQYSRVFQSFLNVNTSQVIFYFFSLFLIVFSPRFALSLPPLPFPPLWSWSVFHFFCASPASRLP